MQYQIHQKRLHDISRWTRVGFPKSVNIYCHGMWFSLGLVVIFRPILGNQIAISVCCLSTAFFCCFCVCAGLGWMSCRKVQYNCSNYYIHLQIHNLEYNRIISRLTNHYQTNPGFLIP